MVVAGTSIIFLPAALKWCGHCRWLTSAAWKSQVNVAKAGSGHFLRTGSAPTRRAMLQIPLKQLHAESMVSLYDFSEYSSRYHLGKSGLFSYRTPWSSGLSSILFSSHVPSTLQPPNKDTPLVICTNCLYDKARESQSTGDSEIRWITSTKPHVTQLAWHRLKAFGSTQQTLNSPCSPCFPLPVVPPSHLKPQTFVFTILSLFLLRFLVFHQGFIFVSWKNKGIFCLVDSSVHFASEQNPFSWPLTSCPLTLSSEICPPVSHLLGFGMA